MKKEKWRVRRGKRKGKKVALVSRLVKGRWCVIGWFNNLSFARVVVNDLNDN